MTYPTRGPRSLAETTNKRLFSYALAAGAGVFAGAQPAEAGLIYTNPRDITITNGWAEIDIDRDRRPDVIIQAHYWYSPWGYTLQWLSASAPQGGIAVCDHGSFACAMDSGIPIDGYVKEGDISQKAVMAIGERFFYNGDWWGGTLAGPWVNVTDRFLGVQFLHRGNPAYGWVRMDVQVDPIAQNITYTIKDWAYYEWGIPEPGTLGLLALGSVALAAWRRRKKEQA